MGCSSEPKTKEDNKAIKTLQNEGNRHRLYHMLLENAGY